MRQRASRMGGANGMAASIATQVLVEQTVLAGMRCGEITRETTRAFSAMPSPIARTINEAVAEMIETHNIDPRRLVIVAKLFTASVEVVQRRISP